VVSGIVLAAAFDLPLNGLNIIFVVIFVAVSAWAVYSAIKAEVDDRFDGVDRRLDPVDDRLAEIEWSLRRNRGPGAVAQSDLDQETG